MLFGTLVHVLGRALRLTCPGVDTKVAPYKDGEDCASVRKLYSLALLRLKKLGLALGREGVVGPSCPACRIGRARMRS